MTRPRNTQMAATRTLDVATLAVLLIMAPMGCRRHEPSPGLVSTGRSDSATDSDHRNTSAPTIDYSSQEAFNASLARIRMGLEKDTEKELEISLMAITLSAGGDRTKVKEALHGRTVRLIIELANRLE